MQETGEVVITDANTATAVAEGAASEVSTTNDSSDLVGPPASVASESEAAAQSNQDVEGKVSSSEESGDKDTFVSSEVVADTPVVFASPPSPIASALSGTTPITPAVDCGAAASTSEATEPASPTTPAVSSMYSRMMAMKLGASLVAGSNSNAVGSVNSSTKSVQSVDTLIPEPYKLPAEDSNSAATPPQPPV